LLKAYLYTKNKMEVSLEDLSMKVENLSLAIDMLGLNLSAIQNQHLENALVLHNMANKVNKIFEWFVKLEETTKLKTATKSDNKIQSAIPPSPPSSQVEISSIPDTIMKDPETIKLVEEFNKLDVEKDVSVTADIFMKLLNRFPVRTSVPPPIHPLKNYECPLD
jgi:hypothetical protein